MVLISNSLAIESIEIASLRAFSRNVRRHSAKQLRKVQRSLNQFGHVRPILVTPDFEIIDGHLICEALKVDGATTVRAIVVRGLSPAEIRALRLMLHRSADDAIWDEAAVRDELQAMLDAGLDLNLSGFETAELDKILNADIPHPNIFETDLPQTGAVAISQPGDIWICNQHRIGCGDAAIRTSFAKCAANASQVFASSTLRTIFRLAGTCPAKVAVFARSSLRAVARHHQKRFLPCCGMRCLF